MMQSYSKRMALFIQRLSDVLPWTQIAEAAQRTHEYGMPTEAQLSGREKELAQLLGCDWDERAALGDELHAALTGQIKSLEREAKERDNLVETLRGTLAEYRYEKQVPIAKARMEPRRAAEAALVELSKPEKESSP